MNGGLDGYAEGAHDAGDPRFVRKSHDDGQVVVRGGKVEVAVEDALRDGTEKRTGTRECGEVRRREMRADDIEELDGEMIEGNCPESREGGKTGCVWGCKGKCEEKRKYLRSTPNL